MYRAMAEFHFKRGHESKGLQILKRELIEMSHAAGCIESEIMHGRKKDHCIGLGLWASEAAAKKFKPEFEEVLKTLEPHLAEKPIRHLYKVDLHRPNLKLKKAA